GRAARDGDARRAHWAGAPARLRVGILLKVGRASSAERDEQGLTPLRERGGGGPQGIVPQLLHLRFVELGNVETAEPGRGVGERLQHPRAVGLLAEEEAVQV